MFCFFKRFLKAGLITGVVLGTVATATVVIAGPHRAKAVFSQVQGKVMKSIDSKIDDPVALRTQLQEMESEYPKRIAQVRGDLAELNTQIQQLEREQAVSKRVVDLAENDLTSLQGKVDEVTARGELDGNRLAAVHVDDRVYSLDTAQTRIQQIQNTRIAYANRVNDDEHDLKYLRQQAGRLEGLLSQLEKERAQFRSQIVGLSRQVDAIARNERLIDLLQDRNQTIDECSRYAPVSLDQLTGHLAEIRSRQEAQLDQLASEQQETSYEDLARMQIDNESAAASGPRQLQKSAAPSTLSLSTHTND